MGDRSLVLEVIPLAADGTVKPKPPPGAFRIWLQLLKNPGCKEVDFSPTFQYFFLL